jgi:hypothetical protein
MKVNMNAESEYRNMNAELRECRGIFKSSSFCCGFSGQTIAKFIVHDWRDKVEAYRVVVPARQAT